MLLILTAPQACSHYKFPPLGEPLTESNTSDSDQNNDDNHEEEKEEGKRKKEEEEEEEEEEVGELDNVGNGHASSATANTAPSNSGTLGSAFGVTDAPVGLPTDVGFPASLTGSNTNATPNSTNVIRPTSSSEEALPSSAWGHSTVANMSPEISATPMTHGTVPPTPVSQETHVAAASVPQPSTVETQGPLPNSRSISDINPTANGNDNGNPNGTSTKTIANTNTTDITTSNANPDSLPTTENGGVFS